MSAQRIDLLLDVPRKVSRVFLRRSRDAFALVVEFNDASEVAIALTVAQYCSLRDAEGIPLEAPDDAS